MSESVELSAELLLNAYVAGVFPMGSEDDDETLYWIDPPMRGVIPLDGLKVSRSLRKRIRRGGYDVRIDADFAGTMRDCADRDRTWINETVREIYADLHRLGFAHSVEIWEQGARVGGLYGVSIGGAFFGESMFSRMRDASKIALVHLVARLRVGGFVLLDTQFITEHLASLGGVEISRDAYHRRLKRAIELRGRFHDMPTDVTGEALLQRACD